MRTAVHKQALCGSNVPAVNLHAAVEWYLESGGVGHGAGPAGEAAAGFGAAPEFDADAAFGGEAGFAVAAASPPDYIEEPDDEASLIC